MSDSLPPPPPPPPPSQPPGGYQQYGYGYGYGPVATYAGFWRRAGAALLDGLLLSIPTGIIGVIVGSSQFNAGVSYGYSPGSEALANLVNTVIGVLYYGYMEGVRGQTLGKMALGIRVMDADSGAVIGLGRGIGRYFARILSAIALGIGYLWMLWDPRKQCWHDKLVRSIVVSSK
jgi:uncharacterized RDD family membrane protein YckC